MSETDAPSQRTSPQRLGGWLLLAPIYLVAKICIDGFFAWELFSRFLIDMRHNKEMLIPIAYSVFILIICVKTLSLFFKRSPEFPEALRNVLLLHICFGVMTSIFLYFGGSAWPRVVLPTLREIIAFWIGSTYLTRSARVASTFTP